MVLYFDVILAYRIERGTFAEAARIVVDAILSLGKKNLAGWLSGWRLVGYLARYLAIWLAVVVCSLPA